LFTKRIKFDLNFIVLAFIIFGFSLSLSYRLNVTSEIGTSPLKSSESEIIIISPQNKTYTTPDNGYYPATYGFENDIQGNIPNGWDDLSGAGCTSNVINSYNGHKMVLELHDVSTINKSRAIKVFDGPKLEGIIEFWYATDDNQKLMDIRTYNNVELRSGPYLGVYNGYYRYWDGSEWHEVGNLNSNEWYHHRIEFNCVTHKYNWYINEILQDHEDLPFVSSNCNEISQLWFTTSDPAIDYHQYFDAVGFSWDSFYNIGDDCNEGLLLSFQPSSDLEWMGYSLDGQPNRTIYGNTTIPMPPNGFHKIKVVGNDTYGAYYESDIRYFETDSLKDIKIITPENKVYNEPMLGYYPATYGFENDEIGEVPQGWSGYSEVNRKMSVEKEFNGHEYTFRMYDNSASQEVTSGNPIPVQTLGTVEFWWAVGDIGEKFSYLLTEGGTWGIVFTIRDNYFKYRDSSEYHIISGAPIPQNNQWYHVRIDFRCNGAPAYQGLNEHRYFVYIDGVNYGEFPFVNNLNSFNRSVFSIGTDSIQSAYVDAVAYSWDNAYNIGDNLKEGLLLSYDSNIDFNWQGYSLDGDLNRTINGNKTIPMPSNGFHKIKVVGNDTYGAYHESDIRYFEIKTSYHIKIITPENKVYNEPMQGYYPATYGFENDADGSIPNGWDFIPHHGFGNGYVVSNITGHKKVLVIEDVSTSAYPEIFQTFNFQTIGTVEFYMRKGFGPSTCIVSLYDSEGQNVVVLNIDEGNNGEFQYLSAGNVYIAFAEGVYADDTWFHIRIDFNTQTDTFDVYLNNHIVLSNIDFYLPALSIEKIRFGSNYAYTGIFYIDALGYSWDPNYFIGDNLKEGLLLSFENGIPLDWIGYSLDGQPNRTIFGNTTIPMPSNGIHSIKVFGVDSFGSSHQSFLRTFTIDYQLPNPPDLPPDNPFINNLSIMIFTIIGLIAALGLTLFVIITRNNMPRKIRSKPIYDTPKITEKIYFKEPIRQNLSSDTQIVQCPYCLRWDESGGIYCGNCGNKYPENIHKN